MYLNPVRYVLVILNHFNFNNFKTHYTKDLDFKKSVRVSKRKLTITFGCFYFRMFPVQAGRECRRIGFFSQVRGATRLETPANQRPRRPSILSVEVASATRLPRSHLSGHDLS